MGLVGRLCMSAIQFRIPCSSTGRIVLSPLTQFERDLAAFVIALRAINPDHTRAVGFPSITNFMSFQIPTRVDEGHTMESVQPEVYHVEASLILVAIIKLTRFHKL